MERPFAQVGWQELDEIGVVVGPAVDFQQADDDDDAKYRSRYMEKMTDIREHSDWKKESCTAGNVKIAKMQSMVFSFDSKFTRPRSRSASH